VQDEEPQVGHPLDSDPPLALLAARFIFTNAAVDIRAIGRGNPTEPEMP
jgi:hypothetical protein